MDVLQSKAIDGIRFPLIIMVVFIHNVGLGVPVSDISFVFSNGLTSSDLYNLFRKMILGIFGCVAVPTFYVISGYLFFYNIDKLTKNVFLKKIKSRFSSLLIPYVCWNTIAYFPFNDIMFSVVKGTSFIWPDFSFSIFLNYVKNVSVDKFGHTIYYFHPINMPLWYVRNLMVLVLLTPLIDFCLNRNRWVYLLIVSSLVVVPLDGRFPYLPALSFMSLFYFSIGCFLGKYRIDLTNVCNKIKMLNYFLSLFLFVGYLLITINGSVIYGYNYLMALSFMVTMYNVCCYFILRKGWIPSTFLCSSVFFILVVHNMPRAIVIPILGYKIQELFGTTFWGAMSSFLLVPITKIFICLFFFWLLGKVCPRTLSVLIGKRVA